MEEQNKMLKISRIKRQKRIRAKIRGNGQSPRVSIFRSNKFIYAQAINDESAKTLASVSESELKEKTGKKLDRAKALGLLLSEKLKKEKLTKIIFDRGSFRYHGRVEAFAQGLREGGITF